MIKIDANSLLSTSLKRIFEIGKYLIELRKRSSHLAIEPDPRSSRCWNTSEAYFNVKVSSTLQLQFWSETAAVDARCHCNITTSNQTITCSQTLTGMQLTVYRLGQEQKASNFCPYLRQILTDFQNSFTGTFCEKFEKT